MKDNFWYLGSMLHRDEDTDEDVTHRVKEGWTEWHKHLVFYVIRGTMKLKGRFNRMMIRSAMLYEA
jgi:hypothetical protein